MFPYLCYQTGAEISYTLNANIHPNSSMQNSEAKKSKSGRSYPKLKSL